MLSGRSSSLEEVEEQVDSNLHDKMAPQQLGFSDTFDLDEQLGRNLERETAHMNHTGTTDLSSQLG